MMVGDVHAGQLVQHCHLLGTLRQPGVAQHRQAFAEHGLCRRIIRVERSILEKQLPVLLDHGAARPAPTHADHGKDIRGRSDAKLIVVRYVGEAAAIRVDNGRPHGQLAARRHRAARGDLGNAFDKEGWNGRCVERDDGSAAIQIR